MAGYKVDISEPAESDLRDIVRYISSKLSSPMTARNMIDAINEALAGLAYMPHKFPGLIDERLVTRGYRKLLIKSYIIFFTIDEKSKTVDVHRILHARRDWLHIL